MGLPNQYIVNVSNDDNIITLGYHQSIIGNRAFSTTLVSPLHA